MSSKPPPLFPTVCGYCRNLGLNYNGHTSLNCPVRCSLPPCPICGISGTFNHTASHCPSKQVVKLPFIKSYADMIPDVDPFDFSQPDNKSNKNNQNK
uniref:Nanos-type domain-containing protein n=1 Tax=Meloidogyne enterolobii TaxID=390850 RepID=A0A6V7TP70_MELEN|nr:unnamed protein product [Meloidogyne enterolobii]